MALLAGLAGLFIGIQGADAAPSPTPNSGTYVTNGMVLVVVRHNDITYIGGSFTQVGPQGGPMQTRNRIAALDSSGYLTSWNPNSDGNVHTIAVSGSTIYVGGDFGNIGGQARAFIAALNSSTGNATAWNPGADFWVRSLVVSGSTVYVGGSFGNIGGQPRQNIAALSTATGNATSWNPGASGMVTSLALTSTTIYAGGTFNTLGGQSRMNIGALSTATGNATSWNPTSDGMINAIVLSGTTVYTGGYFTTIGGLGRNYIAALNSSGSATSWNPNADDIVEDLVVSSDGTVYTGGRFSTIGGQPRNSLAGLDSSGLATAWNPGTDGFVYALAAPGTTVLAGGTFNNVGGQPRANFAQFDDAPVPADSTWYLAEGTTAWGFSTYISVVNPNTSAVTVDLTYMPTGEANQVQTITMPPDSRATVFPADTLGQKDFSTEVTCREGLTIAADRTMSWTGSSSASPECHGSVGVTSPATTWYLPEGSTNWGFECWLLIQNPNGAIAHCTVTYMIEGEGPSDFAHDVGPNSRATFNMASDIGSKDASIKVESDQPVIPERAMYRNDRREGHDSIGTTSPETSYYLAEGTTAWGFTTYVLVQNPNATDTTVDVTYMTGTGPVPHPENPIVMPANSRKTVRVNDYLPGADFSTKVTGSAPIIAERAMYWDAGAGEACHDSIGMASPHMTFYLPDGEAGSDVETWTLVQNPNGTDVTVTITYMTPDGTGNVTKTEAIPANSRSTFNLATHSGLTGRAAIVVKALEGGRPIMVERAMYWYSRGAGTDTIGGYGD
ncbi:MAG: hypothetical protein KKF41_11655 [Actinobacteria bacterium]|nr:hypothetical protein [Actinomycetota bacterium]MBU1944237.1 hypothetical protein [Actinomycetota bacterium]MBU2688231.1 hypothetical protein [Actinomycetota bacterium]